MSYLGSWKIDDALTFAANTHNPSTGAASDADSAPTYRVYEDETATPILTGTMATLDSANTTGFYSEQITLSAANGFEKGKCYTIYISAAVSSTTGTTHHTFQIEAEVDANVVSDKSGYSLAADQSGVTVGTVNALGTQAKADVNAEADTALTDYDPPTNAEMEARTLVAANYATASNLSTVDGNVDSILVDTGTTLPATLATIASYIDTEVAAIKAVTDNLPDSGALTSLAQASALTTVDTVVDAIKGKTDSLTFTQAGHVDSNVQRINDVAITGDGSTTPFDVA